MPSLARITNTFFVSLINRLGVRPPFAEGFTLTNTVQPVSIVDTDVSISAFTTSPELNAVFSGGELAAPAINATLADTGAQAAGVYNATILIGNDEQSANARTVRVRRRNAADSADIWSQLIETQASVVYLPLKVRLESGERIRVSQGPLAGSGGTTYQASIFLSA